jgi:hypothetical protein
MDLLAAVLSCGASPRLAVQELSRACSGLEIPTLPSYFAEQSDPPGQGERSMQAPLEVAVRSTLALAERAGVPPAGLLRAAADRERSRRAAAARVAIRRLEVLLVVPAGVCLLPAFVLLGVAPVVIALLGH